MDEGTVRDWVRDLFGKRADWIEQAHGSTFGVPDVLLPLRRLRLPVELKFWDLGGDGLLRAEIRPSQLVYHHRAARDGQWTAFLVGWCVEGRLVVGAFPGKDCPLTTSSLMRPPRVVVKDEHCLMNLLSSEPFYD